MIRYETLRLCRELKEEVERYERRLADMDPAGSMSQRTDGMPRASKISRPTEDAAIKYVEVADMMEKVIAKRRQMINEIVSACYEDLPSLQRQIIIERYINARTWKEIYLGLHYSKTWVYTQHNIAIKTLTGSDADTSDQE